MAANTSSPSFDLGDPRLRFLVGLALVLFGMLGLNGYIPLGLVGWVQWFVFSAVFFVGMVVVTLAISNR